MEKTRVVLGVGREEKLLQGAVDVVGLSEGLKVPVGLDSPVLRDAQEDNAVDGHLHGEVQFRRGKRGVVAPQKPRQAIAPAGNLRQKLLVNGRGPAPVGLGLGEAIEKALEDGLLGEDGFNLVPSRRVLRVRDEHDSRFGDLGDLRADGDAPIVGRQMREIRQHRKRELGRPGIGAKLDGRLPGGGDIDMRGFGLQEELAHAADSEAVVGRAGLDRFLVDDVFVDIGAAGLVGHVPAQQPEHRVDELVTKLLLVIVGRQVTIPVQGKTLDQFDDERRRCSHWAVAANVPLKHCRGEPDAVKREPSGSRPPELRRNGATH